MKLPNLYQLLQTTAYWNALESLLYQSAFLLHQSMLFLILPNQTYGLWATLFSSIYLIASLCNMGLDDSFGTFASELGSGKRLCMSFIVYNMIPNLLAGVFLSIIYFTILFLNTNKISYELFFYIIAIVLIESTRKTIKTSLLLALKTKTIAFAELVSIFAYISLVWASFFLYGLTDTIVFKTMVIVYAFNLLYLLAIWHRWFSTLPESSTNDQRFFIRRIIANRFSNFINMAHASCTSPNSIVPLTSYYYGLEHAGAVKLISSFLHTIFLIIHKVIGSSALVFIAHAKKINVPIVTVHDKKQYFLYHSALMAIISILLIIFSWYYQLPLLFVRFILFYSFINYLDQYIIPYEKWLLIYEYNIFMVAVKLTQILLFIAGYYLLGNHLLSLFLFLCITRVIGHIIISISAFSSSTHKTTA